MSTDPVERTQVETDSLDRSIEMISSMYTPIRLTRPERPRAFRFGMSGASVDHFRVDHLSHSSGYRTVVDPTDFVGVITLARGHASYACEGHEVRIATQQSLAFPGNTSLHVEHSGYDLRFVSIPVERIAARAHDLSGIPVDEFRMELGVPRSRVAEARWRATVDFLDVELQHEGSALDNPVVREHALTLLMDAALTIFPNNAVSNEIEDASSWAEASVVRRAVAFIEANAERPIAQHDIAAAVGVDVATLRTAFARHRGMTPTACVRQARLQGADRELRSSQDRGDTTDAILARWGFASSARFAHQFARTFGVPSHHVQTD